MDRRKIIRYRLSANAIFTWKDAGRARLRAEGITRDISMQSAYISTSSYPPVDAAVQVDIFLSLPATQVSAPKLRIRAKAQVLRIDPAGDQGVGGFAIVCSHFRFWPSRISGRTPKLLSPRVSCGMVCFREMGHVMDDLPRGRAAERLGSFLGASYGFECAAIQSQIPPRDLRGRNELPETAATTGLASPLVLGFGLVATTRRCVAKSTVRPKMVQIFELAAAMWP